MNGGVSFAYIFIYSRACILYLLVSVLDIERMATVTLFLCCLLESVSLVYGQTLCELNNYAVQWLTFPYS